MSAPGPQIPQVVLDYPFFTQRALLQTLPENRIPVPTPIDVFLAVKALDQNIQTASCEDEVKVLSTKLLQSMYNANPLLQRNEQGRPAPADDEAEAEAVGGDDEIMGEGGNGTGRNEVFVPVPGSDVLTLLREISDKVDGLSTRVDGLSTRVDGLSTRVDGITTSLGTMQSKMAQREQRDTNAVRWQARLDLLPVLVQGRAFPLGLHNSDSERLRSYQDIRDLGGDDLQLWIDFYSLGAGRRMNRHKKERMLLVFLGGSETQPS